MLRPLRIGFIILWGTAACYFAFSPYSQLSELERTLADSFLAAGPLLYLLPTLEAVLSRRPGAWKTALANVMLGWTVLAWIYLLKDVLAAPASTGKK